jgi:dihydroorotate dehydrogenase (fumarate)
MTELQTHYLGLPLRSPLVASASPLTDHIGSLRQLEAAGAAAVVLPSLFQEQLATPPPSPAAGPLADLDLTGYNGGPAGYLALVEQAKAALSVSALPRPVGARDGGPAARGC